MMDNGVAPAATMVHCASSARDGGPAVKQLAIGPAEAIAAGFMLAPLESARRRPERGG